MYNPCKYILNNLLYEKKNNTKRMFKNSVKERSSITYIFKTKKNKIVFIMSDGNFFTFYKKILFVDLAFVSDGHMNNICFVC